MKQPLTPETEKALAPTQKGAVDLNDCPYKRCQCGICAVCGYAKHTAIHGPLHGQPPGSQPYGHEFVQMNSATGNPLTPTDKSQLTRELADPDNSPFLNALIRQIIHQSTTLADVHYGLSVAAKAIKTASGKVVERMERG